MSDTELQPRDDLELFALARDGDEAAFASIAERHGPALLSFCRHMLGSRQDAEDALQHVFLDALRALRRGDQADHPRAWLFAIARNRCTSMLRARRPVVGAGEELDLIATDGLSAEVERREDLRQLLHDLARLPVQQRAALLLAELHDDSHADIAVALGVPTQKVKALVFQARTALIADRDARAVPCEEIQEQLATLRGSALRRRELRRHVAGCDSCQAYEAQVAAQRRGLAILLPVTPAVPIAALAGTAATGGAAAGLGALLGGTGAKVAATVLVVGAGAIGGIQVFDRGEDREPARDRPTVAATATPAKARPAAAVATPTATATAIATATATPEQRGKIVSKTRAGGREPKVAPTPTPRAVAAGATAAPAGQDGAAAPTAAPPG